MNYCSYYRAKVNRSLTWFFVATFRSCEHIGFDRTFDAQEGIFEFFVPQDLEENFVKIMNHYHDIQIISELKKLPNRLSP